MFVQVNFIASQLICFVLGLLYRTYFGPHKVSPTSRHVIQILIGIPLTYFCFGRYTYLKHTSIRTPLHISALDSISKYRNVRHVMHSFSMKWLSFRVLRTSFSIHYTVHPLVNLIQGLPPLSLSLRTKVSLFFPRNF